MWRAEAVIFLSRLGGGESMYSVELVLDANNTLGEGPSWDDEKQLLYWVDIIEKKVWIYDPKSEKSKSIAVDQMVGAVVPCESGGLMLAAERGFYMLDTETEQMKHIADPEPGLPNNRFNDGKCDAMGRFWAGTMDHSEAKVSGALYCLDKNLEARRVLDSVGISNGLAWDRENKTMYYIDSLTHQVFAFDYDLLSGSIHNRRTVVSIPAEEGLPDGMTIDEEGMLWVAQWKGYQISRWNPFTGEKIDSIGLPAARVTSAVFGGSNLDELYITTARVGLSAKELEEQPHAGGLFRVKLGIKGAPTYRFAG
jgi:sugar lactone lactonase YvrE